MLGTTLVFRLFHVLAGILWMGGVVVLTIFILPAVRHSGSAGGQVMRHMLVRAKLGIYFPILAVLTILSGFWMFWHDMSVSAGGWAASPAGMMYSIGGVTGTLAFLVGGIMVGRSAAQVVKLVGTGDAPGESSVDNAQRIASLQARMQTGAWIATGLLVITAITMAVARYV